MSLEVHGCLPGLLSFGSVDLGADGTMSQKGQIRRSRANDEIEFSGIDPGSYARTLMYTSVSSSSAGPSSQKNQKSFEFTKRKKFADLLITELAEAIILVLSLECRVWFCGTAVTELLGWRDEDLVDGDLIELINGAQLYMF